MNYKILLHSILQSLFFCGIIGLIFVVAHIAYTSGAYLLLAGIAFSVVFAGAWELYAYHTRDKEPDPHYNGHWEEHKKRWPREDR